MPFIQFTISLTFILLFLYTLIKYKSRMATYFTITSLLISIYSLGYGLELVAKSIEAIQLFILIELSALVFIPAFWMLISYKFYFKKDSSLIMNMAIFAIPFLTFFISLTNTFHHLYYTSINIQTYHNHSISILGKGPWYYVFVSYTIMSLMIGLLLFILLWKKTSFSTNTPAFWMVFGSLFPYLAYFTYLSGILPFPYDFTSIGFAFLAFSYYKAIFKCDFLVLNDLVWAHVFNEISEGIILVDSNHRLIDFNKAGQSMFNWLIRSNTGKDIALFDEGKLIYNQTSNKFNIEHTLENQKVHYRFTMTPVVENKKTIGKIYIFQDITKDIETLENLLERATYDNLSGLYNKHKLMEEAQKEFYKADKYGTDLSVLMIDIDSFKPINDTYGHLVGDETIRHLSNIFKNHFDPNDIIGRYGGEEFLVLMPNLSLNKALILAEVLRLRVEETAFRVDGQIIHLTLSIGVSSMSIDYKNVTLRDLISAADQALYRAKNAGRNRVFTSHQK